MNFMRKLRSFVSRGGDQQPFSTAEYWEARYATGGDSGAGSYGPYAEFKADVINRFIRENQVQSVIEFGCGDGHQLSLLDCPQYIGLDVSPTALQRCIAGFKHDATKSFFLYDSCSFADRAGLLWADLALSLDVLFHLVEDEIFAAYMDHLFAAARRYVMIYSWDVERAPRQLARHNLARPFLQHVSGHYPDWTLNEVVAPPFDYDEQIKGGGLSSFYIYTRTGV